MILNTHVYVYMYIYMYLLQVMCFKCSYVTRISEIVLNCKIYLK